MAYLFTNMVRNNIFYKFLWVALIIVLAHLGSSAYAQEISWTGASDGTTWEDPGNWSPTSVPGLDADVTIDANLGDVYTIVLSSDRTINSLTLSISQATLDLQADLTIASTITQTSGAIRGVGDLIVQSHLSWIGGRMEGTGTTLLNGGAYIGGPDSNKVLDGRRIMVPEGEVFSFNGAQFTGINGAVIEIQEGALFDLITKSSGNIMRSESSGAAILNSGTIRKLQGTTAKTTIEWALENKGTLEIKQEDADIRFGTQLINFGTIELSPKTVTLGSTSPIFNDGVIAGVGTIIASIGNRFGIVRPGNDPQSTGTLTLQGAFIQSETGTLELKIGGTEPGAEFAQFITSTSIIEGKLELIRLNDFSFSPGEEVKPLTWNPGSRVGTFGNVIDTQFSDSNLSLDYSPDGLIIREGTSAFPETVQLSSPPDGSEGVSVSPTLKWEPAEGAGLYQLQVSTDENFATLVTERGEIEQTEYQVQGLTNKTTYYWRVRGTSNTGFGEWSSTWIFETENTLAAPLFEEGCIEQNLEIERAIRSCIGEIDFDQLSALLEPGINELKLSLFDGEVLAIATETNVEVWSDGEFSWFGKFASSNNQDIVLEVDLEEQRVFATMMFNNRPYRLDYLERNLHMIYEVDLGGLVDEADEVVDNKNNKDQNHKDKDDPFKPLDVDRSKAHHHPLTVNANSNHSDPVIDLLIVYTEPAKDSSGSSNSIRREIRNAVNNTNVTFQNSGVNARVRLADVREFSYDETGSSADDLNNLKENGQSESGIINEARKEVRADIVGLVVSDFDKCGRAYTMENVSTSHKKKAYFVVKQGICLGNNLSFAHEIGHIMGARHDRRVDNKDGSPFDYNHGYVNPPESWASNSDTPKQWRTVMAYNTACDDEEDEQNDDIRCTRLRFWSNPDSTYLGDSMGVTSGNLAADNVLALNSTADTVAAFSEARPSVFGFITDVRTNLPLEGVDVSTNFSNTTTDENGFYEFLVNEGTNLTITPVLSGYKFQPETGQVDNITDDVPVNFDAFPPPIVSGVIQDLSTGNFLSDVELDGFPEEVRTNQNGFYSIELDHEWSGTVRPAKRGFNFEPATMEYSSLNRDQTDDYDAYSGWLARSDWPMFMANPQHTGSVNVQPASDRVLWELQLDGAFVSPVIGSDESLYIATDTGEFYKADLSGSLSLNNGHPHRFTGATVISSGNRLYMPSDDGLHVINLQGGLISSSELIEEERFYSSPVINPENGMFYVGSETGEIHALDPDDSLIWSFQTGGSVKSSPALDKDGTIYAGSDDDKIYALNPDGTEKWTYTTGGNVHSSPSIGKDGTVYIGSDDGYLYAISSSGNLEWRFSTGSAVQSTPAIDSNGNVYAGSDNGNFYAISDTGQLIWSYTTGGAIKSSPAISQTNVRLFTGELDEEVVYVGSSDGYLYAFDIISLTGGTDSRLRWKYDFGSPVNSSPVLSSKGLIAGSDDGKLIAFKPVSRAWTQGVVMAQDDVPTPDDLAIIIWLDEIGGTSGLIGGNPGMDPCQGGPLIIPNCEFDGGFTGNASPFLPVLADEELIIGLARTTSDLAGIYAGETTEGLLETFSTTLPENDATSLFFGGLASKEGFAENPDGRPVDLQMFSKPGLDQSEDIQPDETAVYAGHFSTDSPAMNINLSGPANKTFNSLRFGDISETKGVPPGNYQVTLELLDTMGKATADEEITYELDLSGNAGEPVAILIDGFLNPEANKNGPSLGVSRVSSSGSVPTSIESEVPVQTSLHNNYPNPFNPVTSIPFDINNSSNVRIEIYNIAGQKILTLLEDIRSPGSHVIPFDASSLSSGVYIYRLVTDNFSESKKMVLIK